MGLDNIPKNYPCKAKGSAVTVQVMAGDEQIDQIDCKATQEAGGCPYLNANPPTEGRVYGMLGTDCWYRGKYGNHLLETVHGSPSQSFYGDNEDGTEKSAESCVRLANYIKGILALYDDSEPLDEEQMAVKIGLIYAEWYLRWAAEQADGLVCWY